MKIERHEYISPKSTVVLRSTFLSSYLNFMNLWFTCFIWLLSDLAPDLLVASLTNFIQIRMQLRLMLVVNYLPACAKTGRVISNCHPHCAS